MPDESINNRIARLVAQLNQLWQQRQYEAAVAVAAELCALQLQIGGYNSSGYASSLHGLAELYRLAGRSAVAERLFLEALKIFRVSLAKRSTSYARSLNSLALVYHNIGDFQAAEPLFLQALDILRETVGEKDSEYAASLHNLGGLYFDMGNYEAAEPLFREAHEIARRTLSRNDAAYAISLSSLARFYYLTGDHDAAEPLFIEALDIARQTGGETQLEYAIALNSAMLYTDKGDYQAAERLYHRALDIARQTVGEKHPGYGAALHGLAHLYQLTVKYAEAERLYLDASEIARLTLGDKDPNYAASLESLANLYKLTGNYANAERLYHKVLDIQRHTLGQNHPGYATSLTALAQLYRFMAKYAEAEPLYREALEIRRVKLGETHPDYAASLVGLANLHLSLGNYEAAEPLFREALDILRVRPGEEHPNYAASQNSLANLFNNLGNYEVAERLYRDALEIRRVKLGETHPDYAMTLNSLANLYRSLGNFEGAERLYRDALNIARQSVGDKHPDYATGLNNLAMVYGGMGKYAEAEPLYREALDIQRHTLGEKHPNYASSLENLAALLIATDRLDEAVDLATEAASIYDYAISQVFSIGSETQRLAYLRRVRGSTYLFLSLLSQRCIHSDAAARLAMDLVLRRKAISAEALATQRDAVLGGKYPKLRKRLTQLNTLTGQIVQETLAGPGIEGIDAHRKRLNAWDAERELLEAELVRQIPEMKLEHRVKEADSLAVAHAIPKEGALVEFIRFPTFDFFAVPARGQSKWGTPHYLAFVLHGHKPDIVKMIDLGDAAAVDRMVSSFRMQITGELELRTSTHKNAREAARVADAGSALRAAVFDPLLPHLGSATRVFLSPDGELTRLPFEALPTSDNRRLIDVYHFSYLTVGRDVLRFGFHTTQEPNPSVVIADPDFDLGSKSGPGSQDVASGDGGRPIAVAPIIGKHSRDLARTLTYVRRLPGTEEEGTEIANMLCVDPWLGQQALERPLKATLSPQILHFATHGFFLENQQLDALAAPEDVAELILDRIAAAGIENPLLRSGLLLAGVNTWINRGQLPDEAEDGILTAADVSGLDLSSTDLVVLSACETGLGDVHVGEGVFGLRRAFALAGTKTLVMSLWKVDDAATKELMMDFYSRMLRGEARVEALRSAQLKIKSTCPNPCYWAAFICQGDPSPLADLIKRSKSAAADFK
jgi:tetratricopeptide (TPR) repeat protein/CHAT domain-containing protein